MEISWERIEKDLYFSFNQYCISLATKDLLYKKKIYFSNGVLVLPQSVNKHLSEVLYAIQ